ncbi:MAG: SIS domain-containing protein [Thermodesulfovibrionales bacterium]|nr:SIS domain-containing protein [Thermodesulfovibrionales bacterium]
MIEIILFDVDGVLTDGKVTIDKSGEESKVIAFDDIDAYFELKRMGIKTGFITAEETPFTEFIRQRFSPDFFISGSKDKLKGFKSLVKKNSLDESKIAFVGDSKKDAALLEHLRWSFAPSDSGPEAKACANIVLSARRGEGVIKEVLMHIKAQDKDPKDAFWTGCIDGHIEAIKALKTETMEDIKKAGELLLDCYRKGGKLLFCGNGGSASDAQHLATELVSRFLMERKALAAESLSCNTSSLTAIGNDYGFDLVFARQVEAEGKKGDVLIGISTSGTSKNVVKAVEAAKKIGMKTVVLTGQRKDTELVKLADVGICIPSKSTPRIQEGHILVGHMLCEYIEREMFG